MAALTEDPRMESGGQKAAFVLREDSDDEAVKYALRVRNEASKLPPVCSSIESVPRDKTPPQQYNRNKRPKRAFSEVGQELDLDYGAGIEYHKVVGAVSDNLGLRLDSTSVSTISALWMLAQPVLLQTEMLTECPETKASWKVYMLEHRPGRVERKCAIRLLQYLDHWLAQRAPDSLVLWTWVLIFSLEEPLTAGETAVLRAIALTIKKAVKSEASKCSIQITALGELLLSSVVELVATQFKQRDI